MINFFFFIILYIKNILLVIWFILWGDEDRSLVDVVNFVLRIGELSSVLWVLVFLF